MTPEKALAELVAAARLRRNVLYDGSVNTPFVGEGQWVCIPRADFDRLRAAYKDFTIGASDVSNRQDAEEG